MREMLLPIVTAFVVGVMLSPIAKRLEERGVPRLASAALIVLLTAGLAALIAALIAAPIADIAGKLPSIGEKLHVFDGAFAFWKRVQTSIGLSPGGAGQPAQSALPEPNISWVPTTLGYVSPPLTGFLYFLIVLLLFISWWPDLRRNLVMTFASRKSRLTVLKILTRWRRRRALPLHRHLHQSRSRRSGRTDRLGDGPAAADRHRGAGDNAQLHPDHRADRDDRGSGRRGGGHRDNPADGPPAGRALRARGLS